MNVNETIVILGAGAFGCALATIWADEHRSVLLWSRDPLVALDISRTRTNPKYLGDIPLSPHFLVTTDLAYALSQARLILCAVPSQSMRALCLQILPLIQPQSVVICAAKGFELNSNALMSQVCEDVFKTRANRVDLAYFSGPSFAHELLQKKPTSVVIASYQKSVTQRVSSVFSSYHLCCYESQDVLGVELAGALKNVFALAAGTLEGLGFGANARATLITRSLNEMAHLGIKLGAHPLTFLGLSGVGDLVLTCTGELSRNHRVGLALGQGQTLEDALKQLNGVAEGVMATQAAYQLAKQHQVSLPIVDAMYAIIYGGANPYHTMNDLLRQVFSPKWIEFSQ